MKGSICKRPEHPKKSENVVYWLLQLWNLIDQKMRIYYRSYVWRFLDLDRFKVKWPVDTIFCLVWGLAWHLGVREYLRLLQIPNERCNESDTLDIITLFTYRRYCSHWSILNYLCFTLFGYTVGSYLFNCRSFTLLFFYFGTNCFYH
jgi:hypothetical protein